VKLQRQPNTTPHHTPQRRDGLVAAQEALLGHNAFGTARRRASTDRQPSSASSSSNKNNNNGPRFQHRVAHPPTPPLLSAQLRALVERELGLPVLKSVGEADGLLAWGVAAPDPPYLAVLSRDSDFLVYAGGRLLTFDLLDMEAMTVRATMASCDMCMMCMCVCVWRLLNNRFG
jgi:hypothetical protein